MSLSGKKFIIGVTGSIAAYKAALLVRLLVKAKAEVRVIMTESAAHFISPLTLSTLSKNEVYTDFFKDGSWHNHVELGLWADGMIIAPASAHTLAKMTHGLVDNMLLATYLSAKCPVFFAPAMDLDMWAHPATQKNINQLQSYGHTLIPVGDGELASGLEGKGRMAEPEDIVNLIQKEMDPNNDLAGKKALITAGPTREPIDPVRFLSNPSTGRMGIALAEELAARGAEVHLILGPTALDIPDSSLIETHRVTTAAEMYTAASELHDKVDIAIFAAAVADFTSTDVQTEKIKKTGDALELTLQRTQDIAHSLGDRKKHQFHIGFALETENAVANAQKKIQKKNFDFIVLNTLKDKGAGFGTQTNKIRIIHQDNTLREYELKDKRLVAKDIVDELLVKLK